jgi:hypothetical protein
MIGQEIYLAEKMRFDGFNLWRNFSTRKGAIKVWVQADVHCFGTGSAKLDILERMY